MWNKGRVRRGAFPVVRKHRADIAVVIAHFYIVKEQRAAESTLLDSGHLCPMLARGADGFPVGEVQKRKHQSKEVHGKGLELAVLSIPREESRKLGSGQGLEVTKKNRGALDEPSLQLVHRLGTFEVFQSHV